MLIALSCIIIILSFCVLPFLFSVKLKADFFGKSGEIKLSVFFIPVYKAKIELEHRSATENNLIISSGKKKDEIHLNADKNDKQSVVSVFRSLPVMSYIIFERLDVEAEIGFSADAFYTTMTAGTVRALFYAVAAFLKSRQNISLREEVRPCYNKNELDFNIFGILKLSIANIINSFIAGLLNKSKNKGVI